MDFELDFYKNTEHLYEQRQALKNNITAAK